MPPITLTRDLGVMPIGITKAHEMADADGKFYIVKFKENALGSVKVLINEYVAGKIAEHLDLPCAKCYIAEIDSTLAPTIEINGIPVSVSSHFAVEKLNDIYVVPFIFKLIPTCQNKDKYPDIMNFDVWLYNWDRNNSGNYLILTKPDGYHFYIIDHGHCFNLDWSVVILAGMIGAFAPKSLIPQMSELVTTDVQMEGAITKIEAIDDNFLRNLVDDVPADWIVDPLDKDALKDYIVQQKKELRKLIFTNKAKFANWK